MQTVGWTLGVVASFALGPIVYLLARLLQATPPPQWAPVPVRAWGVTRLESRRD
jgi:hypothetical protein